MVDVKECRNKSLIGDYNNNSQNNETNQRENQIMLTAEVHHYESRSLDNLIDSQTNGSIESDMPELADSIVQTNEDSPPEANAIVDKCKASQSSVKLRDSLRVKGVGSDGRSSSGNWSASSSTHASESVDSDNQILNNRSSLKNDLPHTLSNSSLGKDSVISDSNTTQTQTESEGRTSAATDHSSAHTSDKTNKGLEQRSGDKGSANNVIIRANNTQTAAKVQYANRDSESWLQYYDSSETVTPTPSESERAGQVTRAQATTSCSDSSRRSSFSAQARHGLGDDEVESVYSVDNDGYYTSMHTDSGLFRLPVKLMITPNSSFRLKGKRDSIASNCTVGDISINSILSRTETESSTTTLTNHSSSSRGRPKMPPPPPPPRVSSMLQNIRHSIISNKTNDSVSDTASNNGTTTASNTSTHSSSRSHSPSPATVTSESDHSDFTSRKLRAKTCIDSSRYPSMCAITSTENSDDCRSNSSDSSSHRMTPTRRMLKSRSGSYIGFKIKDIFGFGIKEERAESCSPLTIQTPTANIATIRRPQSPFRFNMYNQAEAGGHRVRRFIDKFNATAQNNTYQTPNIVRANAISSFASDSNECSDSETKVCSESNAKMNAISEETSDERTDVADTNNSNASRPVPNPRQTISGTNLKKSLAKVPHNGPHAGPKQVSIPVPKALNRLPSKPAPETVESTVVAPTIAPTKRSLTPTSFSHNKANRVGARVTLDPDGEVIYASNSLGRRRDGHPKNYLSQLEKTVAKLEEDQRCATLPKALKPSVSSPLSSTHKPGLSSKLIIRWDQNMSYLRSQAVSERLGRLNEILNEMYLSKSLYPISYEPLVMIPEMSRRTRI